MRNGHCPADIRASPGSGVAPDGYSGTNGGYCVEVSAALPDAVAVRDSKDPGGPRLIFTPQAWATFTEALRLG